MTTTETRIDPEGPMSEIGADELLRQFQRTCEAAVNGDGDVAHERAILRNAIRVRLIRASRVAGEPATRTEDATLIEADVDWRDFADRLNDELAAWKIASESVGRALGVPYVDDLTTRVNPVGWRDACLAALATRPSGAGGAGAEAIVVTDAMVESVAEAIYDTMRAYDDEGARYPWVPGGNSTNQDEARRRARAAFAAAGTETGAR